MVRLLGYTLGILLLSGCANGGFSTARESSVQVDPQATGSAEITEPDGTRYVVPPGGAWQSVSAHAQQPSRPEGPAKVKVTRTENGASAEADTPSADNPSAVLADMWWLQALGVLLLIAGAVLFAVRRTNFTNPVLQRITNAVPPWTGRIMMVVGGGLIVLPYYLEEYGGVLLIVGLGTAAVIGLWWWQRSKASRSSP